MRRRKAARLQEQVNFNLHANDKKLLVKLADDAKLTMAEYIRALIHAAATSAEPEEQL